MKSINSFLLAIIFAFTIFIKANAQAADTIWLVASNTAYKTGETVIVTINAISATAIQGFTFQIRYDPACLQPVNVTSPMPGMNGLSLPQTAGLVDVPFASTTPQTANGILAEVRFLTLTSCQTNLTVENAELDIRTEEGFAAPLAGVTVGERTITLNIDKAVAAPAATQPVSGTPLALGSTTPPPSDSTSPTWAIIMLAILLGAGVMFGVFKSLRQGNTSVPKKITPSKVATVQIKRGTLSGKIFSLNKLPCNIGRDPLNEICLDDPFVTGQHAKIFTTNNDYYLMDLGGETFINGQAVQKSSAVLRSGDMVRLGKNVFFVFGL
jgi:hypothetical protein